MQKYLSVTSILFEQQFDVEEQQGLGGLWEAPGRGTKRKWQEEDMQYLEQCLEQQERTYNSKQLANVLEQERQVNLSADAPSTYPTKKGEGWKRTRHSQQRKQDPRYKQHKQAQLDALKQVAQSGYIELMYHR